LNDISSAKEKAGTSAKKRRSLLFIAFGVSF
jgi:hypothetical protein